MATKAQNFRAQEQQKRHEPPKPKKHRGPYDPQHTDTRNVNNRTARNAGMALEDSESGRPSRKSTRASIHHGRPDELLMRTHTAQTFTPKARAQRSKVAKP